ncbi:MAG TPA: MmcQ/YjbR family DNA-binding protein [Flavobacteriales bacterium]|nr:MmcQ/YjbR family DNA-binding protein [Flavobacteriales bacterium]HQW86411.1 MmcQ/YjbR family DNA-binding protein [Flavobacteriales bacterium]
MDAATARDRLLTLPGITEHDHFGRPAYRATTAKGRPTTIFLTLWLDEQRAVLLLDVEQQADLHARHPQVFFPVPNKWGAKGATFLELARADERLFTLGVQQALAKATGDRRP